VTACFQSGPSKVTLPLENHSAPAPGRARTASPAAGLGSGEFGHGATGHHGWQRAAAPSTHPPHAEESGKRCAWQRNERPNSGSERKKQIWLLQTKPSCRAIFQTVMTSSDPSPIFWFTGSASNALRSPAPGVRGDSTVLETQIHLDTRLDTQTGFGELCVDATAVSGAARVSSAPRSSQSLNLAAVSKPDPAGIATPIAQFCSSEGGIFLFA